MIKFSEKLDSAERMELPASNYQDIKPTLNLQQDKVYAFWDKLFDGNIEHIKPEFTDEEILSEIYGRDTSEFHFDIDLCDEKLLSTLSKFDDSNWAEFGEEDKIKCISELASVIGDKLGITEKPELRFFDGDDNLCGAFSQFDNSIEINKSLFSNPKEIIDTIAHEMRHAYQCERACIGETYQDKMYGYNFLNYIKPVMKDGSYINYFDYQDQLIEAEARAFADLFTK